MGFDDLHALDFPRAAPDLAAESTGARVLAMTAETRNPGLLGRFAALERLKLREPAPTALAALAGSPALADLRLHGLKTASLPPLPHGLRVLLLHWAPRLESLAPLVALQGLEWLGLGDLRRIEDFDALGGIATLRGLSITAGLWKEQPVRSLAFLARLPALEELELGPIRLAEGSIADVGRLTGLRRLRLANIWPVRELVRLKVALPGVECACFAPTQAFRTATAGDAGAPDGLRWTEEVMLNGRPVRHMAADDPRRARLVAARTALFAAWEAHYRSVPDPLTDRRETL